MSSFSFNFAGLISSFHFKDLFEQKNNIDRKDKSKKK
jgi:hypothetical protein